MLRDQRLRPLKRLGQNFLINPEAINKILEAAELNKKDLVLEIGAGTGLITQAIAGKASKVIALEKDPRLCTLLEKAVEEEKIKNIELIQKDVLNFSLDSFKGKEYKVIANLPYYITAPTIRKLLETPFSPVLIVLIIQKEVAQRILARPQTKNKKTSKLTVFTQLYAETELIGYLAKDSFWPQPQVDAAIIRITPNNRFLGSSPRFKKNFGQIVKAGFNQPRKQLANNISCSLKQPKERVARWLKNNHIEPEQRAESLAISDWIRLAKKFSKL